MWRPRKFAPTDRRRDAGYRMTTITSQETIRTNPVRNSLSRMFGWTGEFRAERRWDAA